MEVAVEVVLEVVVAEVVNSSCTSYDFVLFRKRVRGMREAGGKKETDGGNYYIFI